MILTCPNCQTRYKVASTALSAAGRQVRCAACAAQWHAVPEFPAPSMPHADPEPSTDELVFRADQDTLFGEADEKLLDEAFARTEAPVGPQEETFPAPPGVTSDPSADKARSEALARRRQGMMDALPLARFRRQFRVMIALVLVLALTAALALRTDLVRAIPQLDGLYRAAGLGTNVVGLAFTDVRTLRTTREGNGVLVVTAKISNTTNRVASVPSVLVGLLDDAGQLVYEWTVNPSSRTILPGDVLELEAPMTAPPEGARTVRLSFVEGQNGAAPANQSR